MRREQLIGILLISGAIGVFIPFTLLTMMFEYPEVLRQDAGIILTKFHQGGAALVWVWWAFAILGLPLLWAYVLIGQTFEENVSYIRWATTVGIMSGIVQIIGLLRWTFVVPVLAHTYVGTTHDATREAAKVVFQAVHQFGGVLLGEHLGQLFTIAWTVMIARALEKLSVVPAWLSWFGYIASITYLIAQAELFATVIPNFPVWDPAGMIGSTMWIIWLVLLGIRFLKSKRALPMPRGVMV